MGKDVIGVRKIGILLMAVILVVCCALSVSASNRLSSAQVTASVFNDGSCQVNMTMTIRIDQQIDKLFFPIPENATAVSLNGSRVAASRQNGVRQVNLTRVLRKLTGELSFSIQYTLPDVIHTDENDMQQLQLPLLSGFQYPIESLQFTVTMPGEVGAKPAFTSGYHQSSIEADMDFSVEGMTITGVTLKPLKDHETLVMTVPVSDDMFPRALVVVSDTSALVVAMEIFAVLAVVYWLLFLRYIPMRRQLATEPPEGYGAGVLGAALSLQGTDLTLMVLDWAQLGYLTLCRDRDGRVYLRKRMDMGNERSAFEQRTFQKLFAKGSQVDTGSLAYARLLLDMGKKLPPLSELIRPRTGNVKLFRGLLGGIGLCAGAGIGLMMGDGAFLQGLLVVLMAALGGISGWHMAGWSYGLGLRHQKTMYFALALCLVWLLLGVSCGQGVLALWMVVAMAVGGLLLRFAGLRTELGRQTAASLGGLRSHLRKLDPQELEKRCEADPDYFFRLYPYALALGVEKSFCKAFGRISLGECPYVVGGPGEGKTASTWSQVLQAMASATESRAKRLPLERFIKFLRRLRQR